MNATFHELTEAQIEAIVSKLPMPVLTDEQEQQIVEDFADAYKWIFKAFLLGQKTQAECKRQLKAYRKYRLESMRWHQWVEQNAVKFDHNRGKYVGHF